MQCAYTHCSKEISHACRITAVAAVCMLAPCPVLSSHCCTAPIAAFYCACNTPVLYSQPPPPSERKYSTS
eukprot:6073-Heterococcus_DN1.PRE.3